MGKSISQFFYPLTLAAWKLQNTLISPLENINSLLNLSSLTAVFISDSPKSLSLQLLP